MAVKLRLMRFGKKKQPVYRLVAADARSPRDGRFIEILGTYEPRQEPSRVIINRERVDDWLSKGAKPTDTVARLLRQAESEAAAAAATAGASDS
ncbi:MAG: 30S ribosomal protein S16 [Actinomycetota bacterium]|nr:30S ribosomal protein S16 [Actinomycetota bacterium]